ncbi:MAG: TorF family putative porin [Pseudomonadota bacterium]
MHHARTALAGLGVLVATTTGAMAQQVEVSGNVTLTSNYVFRGITQSDDGPAIQGGFDVSAGGWYAGTWASSIDFGDDTTMEIDFYGGYSGSLAENTSYDVGVIYYAYPDSPELATGTQDFFEIYGGVSHSFGVVEVGGSIAYSPEFYGETGESLYYLASASYAVAENVSLDATYGVSSFEEGMNNDYQDYSLGGTYSHPGTSLDFSLQFYGTTALPDNTETLVFSVGKSL